MLIGSNEKGKVLIIINIVNITIILHGNMYVGVTFKICFATADFSHFSYANKYLD